MIFDKIVVLNSAVPNVSLENTSGWPWSSFCESDLFKERIRQGKSHKVGERQAIYQALKM